jgi:hypothetical protein
MKGMKILMWIFAHQRSVVVCWFISVCVMIKLHAVKRRNHGLIRTGGKKFFYIPKHPDWLWVPFSHVMNEYLGMLSARVKRPGLAAHLNLLLRLRIWKAIPPLPHALS